MFITFAKKVMFVFLSMIVQNLPHFLAGFRMGQGI